MEEECEEQNKDGGEGEEKSEDGGEEESEDGGEGEEASERNGVLFSCTFSPLTKVILRNAPAESLNPRIKIERLKPRELFTGKTINLIVLRMHMYI